MFSFKEVFPGVFHITDCMGVNMTLLRGTDKALLIDAGYGIENIREQAEALAGMPVQLLLTHGHHDHALGAAHFSACCFFEDELEVYRFYTRREQRERVAGQASGKGLSVPRDFLTRPVAEPEMLHPLRDEETGFDLVTFILGGLTARVYRVPGHTPGSAVIFVPEHHLLLTGDNWNPCTWAWFPEAESIRVLKSNMLALAERLPAERLLCSHRSELFPAGAMKLFYDRLTDEMLRNAPRVHGEAGDIRRLLLPDGTELMFDAKKAGL